MAGKGWVRGISMFALVLVACAEATGPAGSGGATQTDADLGTAQPEGAGGATQTFGQGTDGELLAADVSYHANVRPLIETHCLGCHGEDGVGPFSMVYEPAVWANGAPWWALPAALAVEQRQMPPWSPDPDCGDFDQSRRLDDGAVATFAAWRAAGAPEGDPASYVPPEPADMLVPEGAPTLELMPSGDYVPDVTRPDDYHCFLLPHTFERDSYLVGTNVLPGNNNLVHHVIIYSVPESQVPAVQALDDGEPGLGYTCFGGPGVAASNIGGWVPGMLPQITPEDTAYVIEAGSRIAMQVHYNALGAPAGEPPAADRTAVQMWLLDEGQRPGYRVRTVAMGNHQIRVAPDDPESIQQKDFTVPVAGQIVAVLPHMHLLGSRISVSYGSGADAQCLVSISEWDFNWQQQYRYRPESYIPVEAGDRLSLTCVYDNSAANQPVVNGQQLSPRAITWGEGTLDEMCLNYVYLRTPMGGNPSVDGGDTEMTSGLCPEFADCTSACQEGDGVCFWGCVTASDGCSQCGLAGLTGCAPGRCSTEGVAFRDCADACGGATECGLEQCRAEYDVFYACMAPHLDSGVCSGDFASCL